MNAPALARWISSSVEADGDVERRRNCASLRYESGQAGRIAADGVIGCHQDSWALLEVNSETDFVIRDDNFAAFADKVCKNC